jgi:hypothetical protein
LIWSFRVIIYPRRLWQLKDDEIADRGHCTDSVMAPRRTLIRIGVLFSAATDIGRATKLSLLDTAVAATRRANEAVGSPSCRPQTALSANQ